MTPRKRIVYVTALLICCALLSQFLLFSNAVRSAVSTRTEQLYWSSFAQEHVSTRTEHLYWSNYVQEHLCSMCHDGHVHDTIHCIALPAPDCDWSGLKVMTSAAAMNLPQTCLCNEPRCTNDTFQNSLQQAWITCTPLAARHLNASFEPENCTFKLCAWSDVPGVNSTASQELCCHSMGANRNQLLSNVTSFQPNCCQLFAIAPSADIKETSEPCHDTLVPQKPKSSAISCSLLLKPLSDVTGQSLNTHGQGYQSPDRRRRLRTPPHSRRNPDKSARQHCLLTPAVCVLKAVFDIEQRRANPPASDSVTSPEKVGSGDSLKRPPPLQPSQPPLLATTAEAVSNASLTESDTLAATASAIQRPPQPQRAQKTDATLTTSGSSTGNVQAATPQPEVAVNGGVTAAVKGSTSRQCSAHLSGALSDDDVTSHKLPLRQPYMYRTLHSLTEMLMQAFGVYSYVEQVRAGAGREFALSMPRHYIEFVHPRHVITFRFADSGGGDATDASGGDEPDVRTVDNVTHYSFNGHNITRAVTLLKAAVAQQPMLLLLPLVLSDNMKPLDDNGEQLGDNQKHRVLDGSVLPGSLAALSDDDILLLKTTTTASASSPSSSSTGVATALLRTVCRHKPHFEVFHYENEADKQHYYVLKSASLATHPPLPVVPAPLLANLTTSPWTQSQCSHARRRPPNAITAKMTTDIIVMTKNRPLQTLAFLESLHHSTRDVSGGGDGGGVGTVFLLYHTTDDAFDAAYRHIVTCIRHQRFTFAVELVHDEDVGRGSFGTDLLAIARQRSTADCLVLAVDELIWLHRVDFAQLCCFLHVDAAEDDDDGNTDDSSVASVQLRLGANINVIYGERSHDLFRDRFRSLRFDAHAHLRVYYAEFMKYDYGYVTNVDGFMLRRRRFVRDFGADVIGAARKPAQLEGRMVLHALRRYARRWHLIHAVSPVVNNMYLPDGRVEGARTASTGSYDLLRALMDEHRKLDVERFARENPRPTHVHIRKPIYYTSHNCTQP